MPDQAKHYFLTVLLTDKYVQSSLVSNNGQGVQIKEFSDIKTYFDRQDLLDQLDKSLQQLGSESQDVVETVFALDHTWLEDGDLSDLKRPIVKEISEELSLDAIGQISIPEALAEARLIGDESDSCLLIIFKEDSLDLIFLKHGQFLDLITVGRSGSVVDDFAEILARAAKKLGDEGKYFPGKVLMTSIALKQKEMESLHGQLIKEDWTKNPGFAQAPTIVVLEPDYMIKSISLSAGKVISKENLLAKMPKREIESRQPILVNQKPETVAKQEIKPELPQVQSSQVTQAQSAEYAVERSATNLHENVGDVPEKSSASSFGINFDQNYFSKKDNFKNPSSMREEIAVDNKPNKKRSPIGRFYFSHKKMILIGFAAGLLGLLTIATIFSFFLSKVKIVLTPEQTLLQKSVVVTLDPSIENSDFSKALLKASLQNKEISGQDVTSTTGIGLVGDKAKGKITIYNKTTTETELKQGTIVSSNDIDFLIDADIKVPASVLKQDGSGVDFGKAETNVTAKDIGSDANFNKETKFRVADYFDDKFSATAADNFSGGSSREVRVVAEVDQNRLLDSLSKKLAEEVAKEFNQESKDGLYLVPTGKTKVVESTFSAKLGDETESLTLNLTLEAEAVKYLSADLKKMSSDILQKDLPAGYSFVEEPSLMSDKAQAASNSSKIKLSADLSVKATANLNLEELKKQVLGKSWLEAEDYLENNSEIKQAQVIFNPPFLINILRNLPDDQSRIILELSK
jgi:hypothetical protein